MHYDDGLDLIAPPIPDAEDQALVEDATNLWWAMPIALIASTGVSVLFILALFRLLK